jgi:hypothetical protein
VSTASRQNLFRIEDLAEKASAAIVEALHDNQEDLYAIADRVLRTTEPEKTPILRASFSLKVDLRTSTVRFELSASMKMKDATEVQVLDQQMLAFSPSRITKESAPIE